MRESLSRARLIHHYRWGLVREARKWLIGDASHCVSYSNHPNGHEVSGIVMFGHPNERFYGITLRQCGAESELGLRYYM